MKVLEANGIKVSAFCDNDANKLTRLHHGRPVFSPESLREHYPNAIVFIGAFHGGTFGLITEQLARLELDVQQLDVYPFLHAYFTDIARREHDRNTFAETIQNLSIHYSSDAYQYGYYDKTLFASPPVVGVITQRCNLRCIDCGQRIPYYELPKDFSADKVIAEIKQYCSAFDLVPEISLHGGEPFLHPELGRICREISKIPNLVFVNLTTNGKIVPSENTLRDLSSSGVDIHQSDYGKLSKFQNEVFSACAEHHIYCDIHFVKPSQKWVRSPSLRRHNRSPSENDEIYRRCISKKICCQIMDGRLYRCPQAHASAQGILPLTNMDFIDLNDTTIDPSQKIQHIRAFVSRDTALSVCDYCSLDGGIQVEPAIQLSKKNRLAVDSDG